MTDRETGRWLETPQGASFGRASEPRRGNKPKEGTGGPRVARPADRPGLVGGARPWSRPADTPERVSTDGEGATEPFRIPKIRRGAGEPSSQRVLRRAPRSGRPAMGARQRKQRRSSRSRSRASGPGNLRSLPRTPSDPARAEHGGGTEESPTTKARTGVIRRRRAPREGNASVGVRTRVSSRAPWRQGGEPMPELRRPLEAAGSGRNAATDNPGGRRAVYLEHSDVPRVGTNLLAAEGESPEPREGRNGRRGAARSDVGRLPTRTKPSQGGAPRDPPRPIRGRSRDQPTTDAGSTWRTPDPIPAATCRNARTEEAVEVVRIHEDGTSGGSGIPSPKPRRTVPRGAAGRAGVDVRAAIGRGETPTKGREVPGEARSRPRASGAPVDGSGQTAGDDATGEAVNRSLTIPERALARESVRWPSVTTNHETGRWKGQRPARDQGRQELGNQ